MKILTGELRGRSISFSPNPHLRPTADKVRKAVFDALQGFAEGKAVLDLFAGTGALGFEALSSGASFATFIEIDRRQAQRIKENLEELGCAENGEVILSEALDAVRRLAAAGRTYGLTFIDPPYGEGLGEKALRALAASRVCDENGLIVLECRKDETVPEVPGLEAVRAKLYGDTRVVLYRPRESSKKEKAHG